MEDKAAGKTQHQGAGDIPPPQGSEEGDQADPCQGPLPEFREGEEKEKPG
jgi:hypothetical protein